MAQRKIPYTPYEGSEPYLYFAFCREDTAAVLPLLKQLYSRGWRIWYSGSESREHRLERTTRAALAVIFLSAAALADHDEVKSTALYCQSRDIPVIVIDAAENSDLSTGFHSSTRHVPFSADPAHMEAELIRSGCLTQEMIGSKPASGKKPVWKISLAVLLALAAAGLAAAYSLGLFTPEDTLTLRDPAVRAAVRQSIGSPITPESAASIRLLRISQVPETLEDLNALPELERIEIPQEAVDLFAPLADRYEIVISGKAVQ